MSNSNNVILENFSELSRNLTRKLKKNEKHQNGIYFTPQNIIKRCIVRLAMYFQNIETILEPSCGSCEFITEINRLYPSTKITGIENNPTIFEEIEPLAVCDNIDLVLDDYITRDFQDNKYDLIIGNPPYFVTKKEYVPKDFMKYFRGRPNIFILFIIKSLSLLAPSGILCFVLPSCFLNGQYYQKTRKYIYDNFNIIDIIDSSDSKYIDTSQDTVIFIIQKPMEDGDDATIATGNKKYNINLNNSVVFGVPKNVTAIKKLWVGGKSLDELGFNVSVGSIVWNQCKAELVDDTSKTRLIYSSDLSGSVFKPEYVKTYQNPDKKNFIMRDGKTEPVLIINRGYGNGDYNFQYSLVEGGFPYLIENHLICINYVGGDVLSDDVLKTMYRDIIKSLNDKRTKKYISLFFGNNAINTTELQYMVPIYEI
jgi:adenine-specific DNA-methyltransferase